MSQIDSTFKLIGSAFALAIVVALAIGAYSLFGDRAALKEIRRADKRISADQKQLNESAKSRDNASAAFFAANQSQATALAKDLSHENADFDDAARAAYYRVLNDALRGPEP